MLRVEGLKTSYGRSQVLFGVDLAIGEGDVATLLGRNGMGKTTTVRSIMGMTKPHGGSVMFSGRELRGLAPYRIARCGLGLVPEGRGIFIHLTVRDNLEATSRRPNGAVRWTFETVTALFPWMLERRNQLGGQLSGGEQQMLAIARALMTNPRLLILDEATEGLAPVIRQLIWKALGTLKSEGQSILLIDKNLKEVSRLANRHHIIERGRVMWCGTSAEFTENYQRIRTLVGV